MTAFARTARITVPLFVVLGMVSGFTAEMRYSNPWFAALVEPSFMPPAWVFGVAWTMLYVLLGLAFARVLVTPLPLRAPAVALFLMQLLLNYLWAPVFARMHQITLGFWITVAILVIALPTTILFARIRRDAGALMLPYLAWLMFAVALSHSYRMLNPHAELAAPAGVTHMSGLRYGAL